MILSDTWHVVLILAVAIIVPLLVGLIARFFEQRVETIITTRFAALVVALSDRYNEAIRVAEDAKRSALITHGELVKLENKFVKLEMAFIKMEEAWLRHQT